MEKMIENEAYLVFEFAFQVVVFDDLDTGRTSIARSMLLEMCFCVASWCCLILMSGGEGGHLECFFRKTKGLGGLSDGAVRVYVEL